MQDDTNFSPMLLVQLFGWEIDDALFIFSASCLGGFAWWLTAMYYNVKAIKKASLKRGKQLDIVIIKNEALAETLGTDGVQLGKKFKEEYDKSVDRKIEEYKIEAHTL